jgi:tocopherol O-methyltransferase
MIAPRAPQTEQAMADHDDELDPVYRQVWGDHRPTDCIHVRRSV